MSSPRAVWQAFDRAAATYEQASPLQANVAARLLAQVGERVQPGQVWMDAGCGTGRLARALAARGARVWAIDQAPAMLDEVGHRLAPDKAAGAVQHHVMAAFICYIFHSASRNPDAGWSPIWHINP